MVSLNNLEERKPVHWDDLRVDLHPADGEIVSTKSLSLYFSIFTTTYGLCSPVYDSNKLIYIFQP